MKAGTQFEKLAERIFAKLVNNPDYEKVEHNVNLEGKDGPRQIDVLITSQAAGMEIKTIIECKDYKGKVSVGVIDALHSVMQDVNANKAVAVSSNGFSSTAISKAKRLGISLYTAHEALSEKWKVDIEIPILVTEISSIDANPSFEAYFDEGTSIHNNSVFHVNDTNILDEFANYLKSLSPEEIAGLKKEGNTLCPENIKPPFFLLTLSIAIALSKIDSPSVFDGLFASPNNGSLLPLLMLSSCLLSIFLDAGLMFSITATVPSAT